ncbi:MAG: MIP/aquaporin family protein [Acidobacteriota bacterium]
MNEKLVGEFVRTLVLVLLGNGVVAGVLLKRSKAEGAGWIAITAGWGFAVMTAVFVAIACGSPDAHLNPAVTLGMAFRSGDLTMVGSFMAAQLLGGIAGAVLVWLHYLPHWRATQDQELKLACFSTSPAIPRFGANMLSEIIGTFVLVMAIGAIFSTKVSESGPSAGMGPYLVGFLVWGIGLSLGGPTGYAINPARDLGPRIAHALLPIAGKGASDWGYAAIPVLGPLVGGGLAGFFIQRMHF